MKYLVLFVLFFCVATANAADYVISCSGVTDGMALVRAGYASQNTTYVTTAYDSRVLAPSAGELLMLKAYADSSGNVSVSSDADYFVMYSCEPFKDEAMFAGLMGLAGILAGGLLFYGVLSAFLN